MVFIRKDKCSLHTSIRKFLSEKDERSQQKTTINQNIESWSLVLMDIYRNYSRHLRLNEHSVMRGGGKILRAKRSGSLL